MKKLFAAVLAAAMLSGAGISAFAETNNGSAGTAITVNGEFVAAGEAAAAVSADIIWDELNFVYQDGNKTWDPSKHEEVATEGAWETDTKTITVTNHSNTNIKATLSFTTGVDGLIGSFDKTEFTLPTAENTTYDAAPAESAEFGISGAGITADQKIGTVTVAITLGEVKTADEFILALKLGGEIKLSNDIDLGEDLYVTEMAKKVTVDLNGHTLSGAKAGDLINVPEGSECTVKNGSLKAAKYRTPIRNGGTLTVTDCYIESLGGQPGIYSLENSLTNVRNCEFYIKGTVTIFTYDVCLRDSTAVLNLSGNIVASAGMGIVDSSTFDYNAGEGTYNYDPTPYVDTDACTVMTDGKTWTVRAKVTSVENLKAALADGGYFGFGADIISTELFTAAKDAVIDLDGKKWQRNSSSRLLDVPAGVNVAFRNGTMCISNYHNYVVSAGLGATVICENMDMTYSGYSVQANGANVILLGGRYSGISLLRDIYNNTSTLTMSGDIYFTYASRIQASEGCTVTALEGTYNFDPTAYVDTEAYSISTDGETWTVKAKITSAEGFKEALSNGGSIEFGEDVDTTESFDITTDTVIDFNGKTLNRNGYSSVLNINSGADVTLKNGSLRVSSPSIVVWVQGATLTCEDMNVTNCITSVHALGADVIIRGGAYYAFNLNTDAENNKPATLTISGKTYIYLGQIKKISEDCTVTILEGTYNFDPTAYVDTDKFTVKDGGTAAGTYRWTVTAK